MKYSTKRIIAWYAFFSIIVCVLFLYLGYFAYQYHIVWHKREAVEKVYFQKEVIELQLRNRLNFAVSLANVMWKYPQDRERFEQAANAMLVEHPEIRYVSFLAGDTVISALPQNLFADDVGKNLRIFPFVYSMAQIHKDAVVEGPITLHHSKQEVFLFFQPLFLHKEYQGQIVVALDKQFVMDQLGLDLLVKSGYEYELWRIDPQTGSKETIFVSDVDRDYSDGVKAAFYLPAQWTLSIFPTKGWINNRECLALVIGFALMAALTLGLLHQGKRNFLLRQAEKRAALFDQKTDLYNRDGFLIALQEWIGSNAPKFSLFYFVVQDYNRFSQIVTDEQRQAFLSHVASVLKNYTVNEHFAGRIGEGNFALAVRENMSIQETENLGRGLSLELFWKTRINDAKLFLTVDYRYVQFPADGENAVQLLTKVIDKYYAALLEESPVRSLIDKCNRLIAGEKDVVFDEYKNPDILQLSKTINQYSRQVEQLAYEDPVLGVGNRICYLRDARLLISYDDKRPFHLYCVDICSFSKYNETFSVETGDKILLEVASRLACLFGDYLYRINGDVFLGICLEEAIGQKAVVADIERILCEQVEIDELKFRLEAKIGVCAYPCHAGSPEKLLEQVQVALQHVKQSQY